MSQVLFMLILPALILGCATGKLMNMPNADADVRQPAQTHPAERCFAYCLAGCKVSKGISFDQSKVISDPEWKPSAPSFIDQLKVLQAQGVCPPPEDPNPARCMVNSPFYGLTNYEVQISDDDGTRTVIATKPKARVIKFAEELKAVGQCQEVVYPQ